MNACIGNCFCNASLSLNAVILIIIMQLNIFQAKEVAAEKWNKGVKVIKMCKNSEELNNITRK